MSEHNIVVIAGSMGSFPVIKNLLAELPSDFPAAIFIVVHIPHDNRDLLGQTMQIHSQMKVTSARDGAAVDLGTVVTAVGDKHLLIVDQQVRLGRGPRENMARPAIDALFRSAAASYGPQVIGVLLSGFQNDGAAGLVAIKACGGITVVQNPADSQVSEMPASALTVCDVDYRVDAKGLTGLLRELVTLPAAAAGQVPADISSEVDIALGRPCSTSVMAAIADPAAISCPACGGVLSQIRANPPLRFRCQVGHAYTAECLEAEQEIAADEALRVALRIVEERITLVRRMASDDRTNGRRNSAASWDERAADYERSRDVIRRSLDKA